MTKCTRDRPKILRLNSIVFWVQNYIILSSNNNQYILSINSYRGVILITATS